MGWFGNSVNRALGRIEREERREYSNLRTLKRIYEKNSVDDLQKAGKNWTERLEHLLREIKGEIEDERSRQRLRNPDDMIWSQNVRYSWEWQAKQRWGDTCTDLFKRLNHAFDKKLALVTSLERSLPKAPPATQKLVASKVLPLFLQLTDDFFRIVRLLENVKKWNSYDDFEKHVLNALTIAVQRVEAREQIIWKEMASQGIRVA